MHIVYHFFVCYNFFMKTNLPGVYETRKKDNSIYYRVSITHKGKHISLGSYQDKNKAARAYREGKKLLENSALTIEKYSEKKALSFEKWVCLANFRDNGIYIANPIYIRPKMFYYYLSPEEILKFDADDLFYYSSHKIMRRGGHFFVADYGMQVNIINRYGIKNYGVSGRDYRFINGDSMDFRYSNIEIINVYHGVSEKKYRGRNCFCCKIHINGYYIVGHYKDEIDAAIAYNKAVDFVKSHGITKKYAVNFIDGITPREYAERYQKIKISDKLKNYCINAQNNQ